MPNNKASKCSASICCIPGCGESITVALFDKVPEATSLLKKWQIPLQMESIERNVVLCSRHFTNATEKPCKLKKDEILSPTTSQLQNPKTHDAERSAEIQPCPTDIPKQDYINNLNSYCLLDIFMKLPFEDRVRIGRVCKRWQDISEQTWNITELSIQNEKYHKPESDLSDIEYSDILEIFDSDKSDNSSYSSSSDTSEDSSESSSSDTSEDSSESSSSDTSEDSSDSSSSDKSKDLSYSLSSDTSEEYSPNRSFASDESEEPSWFVKLSNSNYRRRIAITHKSMEKIIVLCGPFLRQLRVARCSAFNLQRIVGLLAEHCGNLKVLKLSLDHNCSCEDLNPILSRLEQLSLTKLPNESPETFTKFLEELTKDNIKVINLTQSENEPGAVLPSSAAEIIRDCPNLKTLGLNNIVCDLTTLGIITMNQTLTRFKIFSVRICYPINPIVNLKNLEQLTLMGILPNPSYFIEQLANNCQKLLDVDIRDSNISATRLDVSPLGRLPNLRCLRLNDTHVKKVIFGNMMSTLTTLKIFECTRCLAIEDKHIIDLLKNAKDLQLLVLRNNSLSKKVVAAANRITRKRTNNLLLKLVVDDDIVKPKQWGCYDSPLLDLKILETDYEYSFLVNQM